MALTFLQRLALRHPNDPDYVEPVEVEDDDETEETDDEFANYLGPEDYEGTARYHYHY